MAVTVPTFIPTPFASEGQFAVIPEAPSSEQGRASWQQGFPQVCAQPLASGGIPPNYQDFQGIFNALSAAICYMQTGALWPWSATLTYPLGAHVLGSDNNEYVAVQENTGQDPTTDTTQTYWEPGITASSVFTAPTASEPGTAGLVPQPQATDPSEQLANILTMRGWAGFDPAAIMPSIAGDGSNILGLGAESAEGVNIDTLLRTGFFAATSFSGTLPPNTAGGILINLFAAASGLYYGQQILVSLFGNVWCRSNNGGIPAGGTPSWTAWQAVGAPKPQAAEGVGQWRTFNTNSGTGGQITVPSGGVWAYFLTGVNSINDVPDGTLAGVAAGGTVLTVVSGSGAPVSNVWGFCWRIA